MSVLPWVRDPCPPAPFVLAGCTAHPPGVAPAAPRLLGDVHVTTVALTPASRAVALALAVGAGPGVLVRASAAWVWSGAPALLPVRVDVAVAADAPARAAPRRDRPSVPVVRTRWTTGATWTVLNGVPVADLTSTATDCARLLPPAAAAACLEALARSPGLDPDALLQVLRAQRHRPGTRQAVTLVEHLGSAT